MATRKEARWGESGPDVVRATGVEFLGVAESTDVQHVATIHHGQADAVLAAREAVLDAAYAGHPERFVRKPPRPLKLPIEVWINPPADGPEPRTLELPRYTNFDEELSQTG